MSKFYIIGKISRDLAKRMQSDPNADRGAAIKAICETVGVKFHSYEWVRGRFDVINVIEGDYESPQTRNQNLPQSSLQVQVQHKGQMRCLWNSQGLGSR